MNFQIETNNFCDLTCTECPNRLMRRPRQFMDKEVWETIIGRYVVPYRCLNDHLNPPTLIPHKDGEPLLNKQLGSMLTFAAEAVPEMHLAIYTHGLLLPRYPDFIDFLDALQFPVVRLLISFHFYNHDGSTNDYSSLTQLLKEWLTVPRKKRTELILVSHIVPPMTVERLQEWKKTWKHHEEMGRVTVHANAAINPWAGFINDVPNLVSHGCCSYEKFDHIFFGVTGNVAACCFDLEEEISFGNVMVEDPAYVVETLRAFYAARNRHEIDHDVCRNCFGQPRQHQPQRQQELIQLGAHH